MIEIYGMIFTEIPISLFPFPTYEGGQGFSPHPPPTPAKVSLTFETSADSLSSLDAQ